jgi:hypothetical protein
VEIRREEIKVVFQKSRNQGRKHKGGREKGEEREGEIERDREWEEREKVCNTGCRERKRNSEVDIPKSELIKASL